MLPRPPGDDALCHCFPSMYSRWRIDCCEWTILHSTHDFGIWFFLVQQNHPHRPWLLKRRVDSGCYARTCDSACLSTTCVCSFPALTSSGSISNKLVAESVPISAKDDASRWFWVIFAYWLGVSSSTVSNHNPHPLNNINSCSPSRRKKNVASGRRLLAPHMYCFIHHVHVNDLIQRRWIHQEDDSKCKHTCTFLSYKKQCWLNMVYRSWSLLVIVLVKSLRRSSSSLPKHQHMPRDSVHISSPRRWWLSFKPLWCKCPLQIQRLSGSNFCRMYYLNENRRRDRRSEATVITDEGNQHHILETDLMDLTDREQPNFRYTWWWSWWSDIMCLSTGIGGFMSGQSLHDAEREVTDLQFIIHI